MKAVAKDNFYNGTHKIKKGDLIEFRWGKRKGMIEVLMRQKKNAPIVKEWSEFDESILK